MTRNAGNLRKAERVEIQIPVRLTRQSFDAQPQAFFISSTRDISSDGAFINTSAGFPEGTLIDVEFDVPLNALSQPIQALAQVARRVPEEEPSMDGDGALGLGMRFVMMTIEEKESLETFVLQKRQSGSSVPETD